MFHSIKLEIMLLTFGILVGCGTVSIRSSPKGADILLMQPGKGEPKPIGKTPYENTLSALGNAANSGPIVIQIKKEGFITQNLYVPNASGSRLEFDTSLQPIGPGNYIEINKIIKLTLLAERQIMQKQYDDALKSADAIKLINDNIAAAWEIEGAAYFVKGDLVKSKIAWIRSLNIDPDNPDTVQILKSINGKPTEK